MELSKQFYKRTTKGFKIVLITVEGSSESVILEVHDIIHKALKGEDWAWDAYNA